MNEIMIVVEKYHREKMIDFLRLFDTPVIISMTVNYETSTVEPLGDWQYQALIGEVIRRRAVEELDSARLNNEAWVKENG